MIDVVYQRSFDVLFLLVTREPNLTDKRSKSVHKIRNSEETSRHEEYVV